MTTTNATRQKRREAKAARRRKRLDNESPRQTRRRQDAILARKGEGVEQLQHALDNAPKGFGAAKPKAKDGGPKFETVPCTCRGRNHGTHTRRVVESAETGQVAA